LLTVHLYKDKTEARGARDRPIHQEGNYSYFNRSLVYKLRAREIGRMLTADVNPKSQ